uniref:Aftiphilin n=1 Tax=Mastacembelus armatus TaxID=205130 RepID=A0A7N8X4Q7_9TELE
FCGYRSGSRSYQTSLVLCVSTLTPLRNMSCVCLLWALTFKGVDRELYELTISKLETSANCYHLEDTLDRLMSAVKTSDSLGKPQQDEELSVEACTMISGLPNLSFMKAKVLMFPSILVPRACCED